MPQAEPRTSRPANPSNNTSSLPNIPSKDLIRRSVDQKMGELSRDGALLVKTGKHTGRAAQSRYMIDRPEIHDNIGWGKVNKALTVEQGQAVCSWMEKELSQIQVFEYQGYVAGVPVQVRSTSPWHIAFCHNMFRDEPVAAVKQVLQNGGDRKIQIYHHPFGQLPSMSSDHPVQDGTAIVVDAARLTVHIVGTAYAGEIKKSAFSLCNYLLPELDFFPMHASANCLQDGSQSCVLFGLSGTGKTTLSASPDRWLIGDDEIVWTPDGIANLEGGCYAKLIHLSKEKEPEIYDAVHRFGSIMENVVVDSQTGQIDLDDDSITENTRGSYCISSLKQTFQQNKLASSPKSIVFLTADAFGALPAVARLNPRQAQYHFISGYTAKVAGTEMGITEPKAAFSPCFGAPFMPRPVQVYADLLKKYAESTGASVWLLNTGWLPGGYGKAERFPIPVSRALLSAIQNGELDQAPMKKHPIFGFEVPESVEGVEAHYLTSPEGPVVEDLARKFMDNFKTLGADAALAEEGGPKI